MERIGSKNLDKVRQLRKMTFGMHTGWPNGFPVSSRQDLHGCPRRVWLRFSRCLGVRLNLDELTIVFNWWENVILKQECRPGDRKEIMKYRKEIMKELRKWTGD